MSVDFIDGIIVGSDDQPIRYEALLLEGVAAVPGVADSTEGTGTGRDTSGSKKWRSGGGGGDSSSMGVMEPLSSRISAPSSNPFSAYIYDPLEVPSPSAVK